jgi:hypothetical protein
MGKWNLSQAFASNCKSSSYWSLHFCADLLIMKSIIRFSNILNLHAIIFLSFDGANPIAKVQVSDLSISALISWLWNQLLGFPTFWIYMQLFFCLFMAQTQLQKFKLLISPFLHWFLYYEINYWVSNNLYLHLCYK